MSEKRKCGKCKWWNATRSSGDAAPCEAPLPIYVEDSDICGEWWRKRNANANLCECYEEGTYEA